MMKSLTFLVAILLFLATVTSQDVTQPTVYQPFSQQELQEVTSNLEDQLTIIDDTTPNFKHGHPRHRPVGQDHRMPPSEEEYVDPELTEEEVQQRKHHRRHYNKMFKWGMIIGTGILAFILIKFCVAKRRRNQMLRRQMQQRQPQIQMQQPYPQTISPYIYPNNQQVQMGRPCARQQRQETFQPQRYPQPQAMPTPAPQAIRGRPHDSFLRQQPQVQAQNPQVEAQIKYHEAEIQRLRDLAQREEKYEMRREVPVNTTESFESAQPIRKKQIPVGQPIYDCNSSFASEYPQI